MALRQRNGDAERHGGPPRRRTGILHRGRDDFGGGERSVVSTTVEAILDARPT
jgi:hypothetical protein